MMRRRHRKLTETEIAAREAHKAEHDAGQRECQICERKQCLSSRGVLVLHGYTRPGYGFIQGACFGVGHVDYSVGTDALVLYLESLVKMHDDAKWNLARFVRGEVTHFTTTKQEYVRDDRGDLVYMGRQAQTRSVEMSWAPGVSDHATYERHLKAMHVRAMRHVEQLELEMLRVQARIAAFKG